MEKPKFVIKHEKELMEIIDADMDKSFISTDVCADFFGIQKDKFRELMYAGKVPFALAQRGDARHNGYTKIDKMALYYWYINMGKG